MVQNAVTNWTRTRTRTRTPTVLILETEVFKKTAFQQQYEETECCLKLTQFGINVIYVNWIDIEQDTVQNVVTKWGGNRTRTTTVLILENGHYQINVSTTI